MLLTFVDLDAFGRERGVLWNARGGDHMTLTLHWQTTGIEAGRLLLDAIAARFGVTWPKGRVLVFDFDVHHGNGTQHAFEERKDVLFCSMHQHPLTLYPGTGFAEERGRGAGLGYTINAPMAPYSTDADYLALFEQRLLPAFRAYQPQFVLISAGFDAHRDDPLAMINLTQFGFDRLLAQMKQLALECCGGKLVSALEGGYNYAALSACVASHLEILQADEPRL